jgi:hypothetical protein
MYEMHPALFLKTGCDSMNEDKVRTKDLCWSVVTIYDPRELPGVSTASPGIGRGVTEWNVLD